MADEYHVVYLPDDELSGRRRTYCTTLDELRAKGWKPSGRKANMHDDWILDVESNKKFDEYCEYWDAEGADAWVSLKVYPKPRKFKTLA